MSKLVDERIVEMGFDNQNFEKNVKTSMNTIDQLKSSLNFSGISSSIKNTFSSLDTSGIVAGLSTVGQKFSTMEIAVITAISNITNRIINMGIELVKSLSVDNIMVGWNKFAEKTISVGTLVAQGNDLDSVNVQLKKLMWYTDETSYNFTDMVSNISKFTATGQSLEDATAAMMGIANWAALSGQNATTASRAMYQLAQSIGQGSVRLEDWRSIQNTNMDTQEFRQNALDAAVAVGQLTRSINGTYTTKQGNMFDISGFTKYLTSDAWLSTDVLMNTLSTYSAAVDDIFETIQNDDTITTSAEAIEKSGSSLDAFGLKAFKAAQEARTFEQVITAIKDAAGTQWMNIFGNIFGDYDEAKVLWSDLAGGLYDLFIGGLNESNQILEAWGELGGRNDLFANTEEETGAFWNLFNAITEVKNLITKAWGIIFPLSEMEEGEGRIDNIASKLKKFTEKLKELSEGLSMSEESAGSFVGILKGAFSVIKVFSKIIGALWVGVQPLLNLGGSLFSKVFSALGSVGDSFASFVEKTDKFAAFGEKIAEVLTIIINKIKSFEIIKNVIKLFELLTDSFKKSGGTSENFIKITTSIRNMASVLMNVFKSLYTFISEKVIPVFGLLVTIAFKMVGIIGGKLVSAFSWMTDLIAMFANFIKTSSKIQRTFDILKNVFTSFMAVMKNFFGGFGKVDFSSLDSFNDGVEEKFNPLEIILKGLTGLFSGLWSILKSLLPILSKAIGFVGNLLSSFGEKLRSVFGGDSGGTLTNILSVGFLAITAKNISNLIFMFKGVSLAITDLIGSFSEVVYSKSMEQYAKALKDFATGVLILVVALVLLASIDDEQLKRSLTNLAIIMGLLAGVMVIMQKLTTTTSLIGLQSIKAGLSMRLAAKALISFAVAVAILAVVLKILGSMDAEEMANGMTGLMMLIGVMIGASFIISKNKKNMEKGARGLMSMALAVLLLSIPLKRIGSMDPKQLIQGLIGITALVSLCILFAKVSGSVKKAVTTSFGMILFAEALLIASIPLLIIGSMGWSKLAVGMAGILGIAGIMVLLGSLSRYIEKSIQASFSMILVSEALLLASIPLLIIGSMGWSKLAVGMAGILGIAGIMILLGALSKYMKNTIKTAAAMVIVSVSLIGFATAAKILGSMSWTSLAKAGAAMLGIAVIMSLIGKVFTLSTMSNTIMFSTALMIVSTALILFAIAVGAINVVGLANLGKALLFLIGVFVVFGIAAMILAPIIPIMLNLSIALLIIAASVLILSVGLTLLIVSFGIFGSTMVATLKLILISLIQAAPIVTTAIGAILSAVFDGLAIAMVSLFALLDTIVVQLISFLWTRGPSIIDTVVMLLAVLLTSIAEYSPTILAALTSIVINLLESLRESIGQIINIVVDILIRLMDALMVRLPEIVAKLVEMTVIIIESIVENLNKLMPRLINAGFDLLLGLIDGLGQALEDNAPRVREIMITFCGHMINAMLGFFGMDTTKSKAKSFIDIGGNLIMGLVNGIKDKAIEAVNAVKNVGENILKGLKEVLGINSPSRETMNMGAYLDEGFKKGIDKNSKVVYKSAESLGNGVLEGINDSGFSSALSAIYEVLNSSFDGELVIRPVMDLTEIQNGTNEIINMAKNANRYSINGSNEMAKDAASSIKSRTQLKSTEDASVNKTKTDSDGSSFIFNNEFIINSNNEDPDIIATRVAEKLQNLVTRRKLQYGKSNI